MTEGLKRRMRLLNLFSTAGPHEWVPRINGDAEPRVCPKCKSPYWDRPRKMSYEEFRDKVEGVLKSAGHPLTWTEIRRRAELSQMFPNKQKVTRGSKVIIRIAIPSSRCRAFSLPIMNGKPERI
jgi:hypothetical protein